MDARTPREAIEIFPSLSPSRRAMEVEEIRLAAIRARDEAIARAIASAARWLWTMARKAVVVLLTYPRRRALYNQLNAMTDRELADIGLTRGDLARVFDPDVATPPPGPAGREGVATPEPANSNVAAARAA
ncbi:MAG: DUF1127 domain-containing protein [Elioraea sp.]|nr:DUF1127 domain-containing protein [Elioraea sp.]MDW8445436.1 DUF1127 domain-containing protein [Acetobacteraceae bacterium]